MSIVRMRFFYILLFSLIIPQSYARDFIHLLTSKGIYETGEDLWLKGLVLDNNGRQLSDASHTAFIELVNPADSVVWQEKYPVIQGELDGHIYVGDEWSSGEYRLYAHTRNTTGKNDTILFPHKILIVNDLTEVPKFLTAQKLSTIPPDELAPYASGLNVDVELDKDSLSTRNEAKLHITVTDSQGNPVQARVALSIFDGLYRYRPSEISLAARKFAEDKYGMKKSVKPFLSNGVSSGIMRAGRKGKETASGQWINVYDVDMGQGRFNLVETGTDGRFEITSELGQSLGRELVMKPLTGLKNPQLILDRPFDDVADLRKKTADGTLPVVQLQTTDDNNELVETAEYSSRRTVHLDEVVVTKKRRFYSHRDKLYGYLDSIHTMRSGAWVCKCGSGASGYLNDYIDGYTHHPGGYLMPKKKYVPKIGESYEIIKYTGPDNPELYVRDIQIITYEGERLSQEELLKEAGLFADQGYSRSYTFPKINPEDWIEGIEDIRNTLLWAPVLETTEDGTLDIVFYTSDIKSIFEVRGVVYDIDGRFADIDKFFFEVN